MTETERKLLLTLGYLVLLLGKKMLTGIALGGDLKPIVDNMEEVRALGKEVHTAGATGSL